MKKLLLNKVFLVLVLAFVAGLIYSKYSSSSRKAAKDKSSLSKVEKGSLIQRSTIAGTVTPFRKTVITAPYQGYVRKVYVKLGDVVKSGDPIASIAPTLLSSEVVFPLRSPFAGKVVQLNKADGEFVKAADGADFIARVDDTSKMYIDANVPELDRVKMKLGLEAIVKASAILDRTYKGIVQEMSFAAREQDRWGRSTAVEFPMRLEILDFDQRIQSGMSVIVDIITLKLDDVLKLRHEYIGKEGDSYFVTLQNGQRQKIQIGIQNEEFSEVKSGVSEGESVRKVDFSELNKK